MDPKWKQLLFDWAKSKDFVKRLWIFGSRARGGPNHPDSDLDVAIEMISRSSNDTEAGRWIFEKKLWKADLQRYFEQNHCFVKTQLCRHDTARLDPDEEVEYQGWIELGVQTDGILIYDSTASPSGTP